MTENKEIYITAPELPWANRLPLTFRGSHGTNAVVFAGDGGTDVYAGSRLVLNLLRRGRLFVGALPREVE